MWGMQLNADKLVAFQRGQGFIIIRGRKRRRRKRRRRRSGGNWTKDKRPGYKNFSDTTQWVFSHLNVFAMVIVKHLTSGHYLQDHLCANRTTLSLWCDSNWLQSLVQAYLHISQRWNIRKGISWLTDSGARGRREDKNMNSHSAPEYTSHFSWYSSYCVQHFISLSEKFSINLTSTKTQNVILWETSSFDTGFFFRKMPPKI